MLDTNVVSSLVRDPGGPVARRAQTVGGIVCTSVIVAAELRFGYTRRGSTTLRKRIEAVLAQLPVLPLEPPADREYGLIRAGLEAAGTPIGANDLLIAAHARAIGATLVTANLKEFRRVPGLLVENWLP